MTLYARAGERVYGTRTNPRNGKVEDYHHATVRHDLHLEEMPDFPAPLGDWQKSNPPVSRHFITEIVGTGTATSTKTSTVDLAQHGGGHAPLFGVVWSGESWWRQYDQPYGTRATQDYDLRFRGPNGTCTWRMDQINGSAAQ